MAKAKKVETSERLEMLEDLQSRIDRMNARLDGLEADAAKCKEQVDALRVAGEAFSQRVNAMSSRLNSAESKAIAHKPASRLDR